MTIRIISILCSLVFVTALVTGCADPFQSVNSQTYAAWVGVANGTKKTFEGTIRYGGKDFPVKIQQRLVGHSGIAYQLDASYYVAGRFSHRENIPIIAKTTRFSERLMEMANLLPPAPKTSGRKTFRLSGDNSWTIVPEKRTFVVNGRSVKADLYLYTIDGIMDQVTEVSAWFSPEIPGGWVALEATKKGADSETNRTMVKEYEWGAEQMFGFGERISLRLVSVEES